MDILSIQFFSVVLSELCNFGAMLSILHFFCKPYLHFACSNGSITPGPQKRKESSHGGHEGVLVGGPGYASDPWTISTLFGGWPT